MKQLPSVTYGGGDIIPDDQVTGSIEFKNVTFEYPTKKDVKVS